MTPRRRVVVTSTFPQFEGDTRGAFVRHHWTRAALAGERVQFLVPHTRWTRGELDGPLEVRRFRYAPTALSSLTGRHGILENIRERWWRAGLVPTYFRSLVRELEQIVEHEGDDIEEVVAHFWLPSGLAVAQVCAGRIPFRLYGHGTDVDLLCRLPSGPRRWLAARLSRASAIYLPSTEKRRQVIEALGWDTIAHKLHVESMGHAICVEAPSPARTPEIDGPYFLFLGRLIPQKGVELLLDATQGIAGARVVIAGDGPLRSRLEQRARASGIDAKFVGWVDGARKADLLAHAVALVVPSRKHRGLGEGAPLVLAEAHALGRPVLGADVGGIAELGAKLGCELRLFPEGDVVALRASMRAVLEKAASPAAESTSSHVNEAAASFA